MMRLDQWDREIAPYLNTLELAARRAKGGAQDMRLSIRMLTSRPPWLARSADALKQAEAALTDTLERVREARKAYDALPMQE